MAVKHKAFIACTVLIGLLICLRSYPAITLPLFGDEGDDLHIIAKDASSLKYFFSDKYTHAWDQARFPHLVAALIIGITGINAENILNRLGTIRFVFLLFHMGYLAVSYRLITSVTKSRTAAFLYILLLSTSCYLASFSIAMLTSGDAAFMFFHILSIKIFYDNFVYAAEHDGLFPRFLLFSLVIACCIASKLFGVLLLVSFFLFQFIYRKKMSPLKIATAPPRAILITAIGFLLIITLLNLSPIPLLTKSIAALSVCMLYFGIIIRFILQEGSQKNKIIKINLLSFWALLSFVSFTLVLCLSPIYLNVKNLLNIFGWFGTWNTGAIAQKSKFYDAIIIMMIKFGILPCLLMLLTASAGIYFFLKYAKKNNFPFPNNFVVLTSIIFFTHLFLICSIQFKLVWHSLAVFPFLYLPFTWLFLFLKNKNMVALKYILVTAVIFVSADNMYRYFSWYPYGHLDGGQYGEKYIGINKPCFVTFECIPIFYDYIKKNAENKNGHVKQINVRGSSTPVLNNYLRKMLVQYFTGKGLTNIHFVSRDLRWDPSDMILSSPVYNPKFEKKLASNNYKIIKSLSISGVTIGNVWKHGQ
jgi:hypothetical protein